MTTDSSIRFKVEYLTDRVAPCSVMFTAISDGITKWDYGDGSFGKYDNPGQVAITHTYKKAGTFQVRAFVGALMSEPQEVTILPGTPIPDPEPDPVHKESFFEAFIRIIKSLLHIS